MNDPISKPDYSYLLKCIEKDDWPIMLTGDWIKKEQVMKLLEDYEDNPKEM